MLDISGSAVIGEAVSRIANVGNDKSPRTTVHLITGSAIVFEGIDAAMVCAQLETQGAQTVKVSDGVHVVADAVVAVQRLPTGVRLHVPGMPQGVFWQGQSVKGAVEELRALSKARSEESDDAPRLAAGAEG